MAKIGMDFGTTYTTSFYWQDGRYECLFAGQNLQSPLEPSIALLYKENLQYGFDARSTLVNPLLEKHISRVFRGFKMLLGGMADADMLKSRSFDVMEGEYSPENIAKNYLKHLLRNAIDRCPNNKVEKLVIGVPQIWFDEVNSISARDSLQKILREIAEELPESPIGTIELESEPALACAFYVDFYRRNLKKNFNGNMLLIDYGGGTLDINLCKVKSHDARCEISILARTGKGINDLQQNMIGKAGMAFLEKTIKLATNDAVLPNAVKHKLEQSLESKLISKKGEITEAIRSARSQTDKKELWASEFTELDDGETIITYGMLNEAYESEIKGTLDEALKDIDTQMSQQGIEGKVLNENDDFKIVLAGGFCNFYLTQKQIYDYFSITSNDPKIQGVNAGGSGLECAIAYGAALVAADEIIIKQTYPYTLGIARETASASDRWIAFKIGEDIEYEVPKYVKSIARPEEDAVFIGSRIPHLLYDKKGNGILMPLKPLDSYKKDFVLNEEAVYKVGFSLDKMLNITLWLQLMEENSLQEYIPIGEPIKRPLPDLYTLFGSIQEVGSVR